MPLFCLNPLSANQQCNTSSDVEVVVRNLLACIDLLLPAINLGKHQVVYDALIENRNIITDINLLSAINNIQDKDLRRRWFIYKNNRMQHANQNININIEMFPEANSSKIISGSVSKDLINDKVCWLSFGKSDLTEMEKIRIIGGGIEYIENNVHEKDGLKRLLPIYENNPKHRRASYYDYNRNEYVAAMPLDDDEAQKLLIASTEHNNARWAYHKNSDGYYKFVRTFGNTYHGYKIDRKDWPNNLP